MICNNCKIDKKSSDFINSENICYRCIYREKLELAAKMTTKKPQRCRVCQMILTIQKNIKKRQRTVYCSLACAESGHKNQINNHWTKKVHCEPFMIKKGV